MSDIKLDTVHSFEVAEQPTLPKLFVSSNIGSYIVIVTVAATAFLHFL